MALKNPFLPKALGLFSAVLMRIWRKTIDWRAVYFDPTADPVHPHFTGRKVFAGWHEYMLTPIVLRGHRSMLALASEHGDGELVARAMHHLGWGVARGSTTRGGIAALLRLLKDDRRHINITPDGPKGPRRCMSCGPIYIASKLGVPLVCIGNGYHRPWRMRSWDRFAVPRPFSRCCTVFGPPLHVPARLDRDGLELYRAWFERLMNWLTEEAQLWADGKRRMTGGVSMLNRRAPWALSSASYQSGLTLPADLAGSWEKLPGQQPLGVDRREYHRAA
jgi:lysophospholipid acyltransferase (LPLAT)-like uncharacterized protein